MANFSSKWQNAPEAELPVDKTVKPSKAAKRENNKSTENRSEDTPVPTYKGPGSVDPSDPNVLFDEDELLTIGTGLRVGPQNGMITSLCSTGVINAVIDSPLFRIIPGLLISSYETKSVQHEVVWVDSVGITVLPLERLDQMRRMEAGEHKFDPSKVTLAIEHLVKGRDKRYEMLLVLAINGADLERVIGKVVEKGPMERVMDKFSGVTQHEVNLAESSMFYIAYACPGKTELYQAAVIDRDKDITFSIRKGTEDEWDILGSYCKDPRNMHRLVQKPSEEKP